MINASPIETRGKRVIIETPGLVSNKPLMLPYDI
jgi:hypothetical protein